MSNILIQKRLDMLNSEIDRLEIIIEETDDCNVLESALSNISIILDKLTKLDNSYYIKISEHR